MAKISVLNIPAHGHINPTLAVVHELVRRGDAVSYFASDAFREIIEATGATFRAYRNPDGLIPGGARMTIGAVPSGGMSGGPQGS